MSAEERSAIGFPEGTPRIRLRLEHVADWETKVVEASYSPKELCAKCGFSMRHMQRFMLKRFRMNLRAFVTAVRMTKAYNLLRAGFTIKETALGLGFKQVSHFCRCFKQHFRANPSTVLLKPASAGKDGHSHDPQLELDFIRAAPRPGRAAAAPRPSRKVPARRRKKNRSDA
jgi:AraC-like DNA-binding protein